MLSGSRILKVNHAGEHGAVNIYRAQRLVCAWREPALRSELEQFRQHEERHRAIFAKELECRGVRRCRSYHLCGFGGFVLGFITGICGRPSIAAVTVAVESVVLRHLRQQIEMLDEQDLTAVSAIRSIIDDEQSHHDHAAQEKRQGLFWPRLIRPLVRASTESVIWLGMKLG